VFGDGIRIQTVQSDKGEQKHANGQNEQLEKFFHDSIQISDWYANEFRRGDIGREEIRFRKKKTSKDACQDFRVNM
jgi:hypothetical protein